MTSKKRMSREGSSVNRREFLKRAAAVTALPTIIPAAALGAAGAVAPSNRITVGCIGVGRMGMGDLRELLGFSEVRVLAVCDVDAKRAQAAKKVVDRKYRDDACAAYGDFRDVLARDDIDVVSIVTPDHWHALPAIAAAKAGKDIFVQKPLTLTIREGRVLSDAVRRYGRVFQTGSQQRSDQRFRFACELARNERIGKLHTVKVGFGTDPGCGVEPEMPVPENLDYDFWLGPAPEKPYTEKRVHPQKDYGRPGWLRISDYGSGMMTGWGAHHLDQAQWGMGTEHTGPVEIAGRGEYPTEGLWDVHGPFDLEYTYASGVRVLCSNKLRGGVTFEGSEGWVWVTRGEIDAHPKSLLKTTIGPDEIHLYKSTNHKGNFLECVKSRAETIAPVENAHRSCTVCILGEIAMRLERKLRWDPDNERFVDDPEADRMLERPMRAPWQLV